MNKMREYERGREDGLTLALRIARQGGVEALEREISFRGITGIHTSLATWPDYIESIKEQLGMDLEIRWND